MRLTNAHQITRLILGQLLRCEIKTAKHRLLSLSYGKTTNRIPFKADIPQGLGTLRAQILFKPTLLDTKKRIPRTIAKSIPRAFGPAHRQFHALCNPRLVCRQCGTFIKAHHNIAAQQLLDLHRAFGTKHMFGTIDMAFERHAIFCQLAQISQAHHLKPTAISKNGLVPIHELMQPTKRRNPLSRGAQHQVIRIAEQNIRTGRRNTFGHHRFYCCSRANGHKSRCADIAPRRADAPRACAPICCQKIKPESLCHIIALYHFCASLGQSGAQPKSVCR